MLDRTDDSSIATENWLAQFETALAASDNRLLKSLFHPDSYWRDALPLSWKLQTINGGRDNASELKRGAAVSRPHGFKINPDRAAPRRVPRADTVCVEAIFRFETVQGRGGGIV